MNFEQYPPEYFLHNPEFVRWVRNPDAASQEFWQNWQEQHPESRAALEEARQMVLFLSFRVERPGAEEAAEVKRAIKNRIQASPKAGNVRPAFRPQLYRMAAVLSGFLLISVAFYWFVNSGEYTEYRTHYGQTQSITLPDGSTVALNANSRLRFARKWQSDAHREVWLEGEAFFEVQKQTLPDDPATSRRFTVHSRDLSVEVLGTTFNVNSRRGKVKVILNTGQVKLNTEKEDLLMQPGELVEFVPEKKEFTRKTVEPELYTSWRHRKLVFEETSLREIAQVIEDNYGLPVKLASASLAERKFTGSVPYQDIDIFLTVLAESFNLNITRNSDSIILDRR